VAGLFVKVTGDFKSATVAAIAVEMPLAQNKPIALDQSLPTARTPSAATLAVMDVAGVNVTGLYPGARDCKVKTSAGIHAGREPALRRMAEIS
jgi:hypothetical protein